MVGATGFKGTVLVKVRFDDKNTLDAYTGGVDKYGVAKLVKGL